MVKSIGPQESDRVIVVVDLRPAIGATYIVFIIFSSVARSTGLVSAPAGFSAHSCVECTRSLKSKPRSYVSDLIPSACAKPFGMPFRFASTELNAMVDCIVLKCFRQSPPLSTTPPLVDLLVFVHLPKFVSTKMARHSEPLDCQLY